MMCYLPHRLLLLLCVLWCIVVLNDVVEAAVTFTPTNVVQLSLYQTAELRFTSNRLVADPPIRVGDSFYFIADNGDSTACSDTGSGVAANSFVIASAESDGYNGLASITVRSSVFAVDSAYVICYRSVNGMIVVRRRVLNGGDALQVWPAIYNGLQMQPVTAAGGQGPVNLTLQESEQTGRPVNQGLGGIQSAFLIPCGTTVGAVLVDCKSPDILAEVCAALPSARISLTDIRGAGTRSVTGSFVAPYVPAGGGYVVCVPYCYSSLVGCGTTVQMSYTVVITTTTPAEGSVVTFSKANPSIYAVTPTAPQAHERGYMLLTGTDLTVNDAILVLREGTQCTSGSFSLFANLQLGAVTVINTTTVNVTFLATELVSSPQRGRVCYRRSSTPLWSSVYKNAASLGYDFVIDVLQPTGFTVAPAAPFIGQPLSLSFTGTGLDAAKDAAFLTSLLACDTISDTTAFPCVLSGGTSPVCGVTVDPPSNQGLTLRVCYRKAGRAAFARVDGKVVLQDRNPVYTLTPDSPYAGQMAQMLFAGEGLSLTDSIQFVNHDGDCNVDAAITTFSIANGAEVEAGRVYSYNTVGNGNQCLQVCYRLKDSNVWSVVRPQRMGALPPECPGGNLYIRVYTLRFELPFSDIRAKETVTLVLSSGSMPSSLKLVRATDKCVLSFCAVGLAKTTACAMTQNKEDFVSDITVGNANILAGLAGTSYVVCAMNGGAAYIPVLPAGGSSTSTAYAFTTAASNPTLTAHSPDTWRVAQAFLSTTFNGAGLSSQSDHVLAVKGDVLLSTTANVCPTASSVPSTVLVSSINPGTDTTSTVAVFLRSDRVTAGTVVHFCYLWDNSRRVTYTGFLTFAAPLPSTMTPSEEPSGGFRAGLPITLVFGSDTDPLQATADKLYFFRYARESNPNPDCYCGSTCAESARVVYSDISLTPGSSPLEVKWLHPRGFDNYGYNAIYVVCYDAAGSGSVTYMGRLAVGMAQPTYYTATNVDGSIVVGYPITFQAVQQCLDAKCFLLNIANDMRLIPATTECYQLTSDNDTAVEAEKIGTPVVTTRTYTQRTVVNVAGSYRLCYRLDISYQELPFSTVYSLAPLVVKDADPLSFTSVPTAPSVGAFLTVSLVCSDKLCLSCVRMRLVPGERASCWETVEGTFTSDNCPTTKSVQFPNQYLPKGDFTVCYGATMVNSRRVPGTLTVAAANPSYFTTSSANIFVNQDSSVTLTLVGTGLTVNDRIFMLTSIGYSCHDIRTSEFQSNDTLQAWFKPSFEPNTLVVDGAGETVLWVVSNRDKRFGGGILSDPSLCDSPDNYCTMQLCYMRKGGTWAPVPIQTLPDVRLLPSDPSSASFDRYPLAVGMYSSVTVKGRGLTVTDTLTVRENTCSGTAATVSVGTPTVNDEKTVWIGVVRFTSGKASRYPVCYTRDSSTTEIGDVKAGDQPLISILPELHYFYDSRNFTETHKMRQYEELIVGASFSTIPETLTLVNLVDENVECNYMPYYTATGKPPEFTVRLNLLPHSTPYFAGRLLVPAGKYALCMQVSVGLFRVTTHLNNQELIVAAAKPTTYTARPASPFANQLFDLIFHLSSEVQVGDSIQIISGTLYDCGTRNTSFTGDYPIAVAESDPKTGEALGISLPEILTGTMLTVCYRIAGGTFATVPRDTLIDKNFEVVKRIPVEWSASPTQPQVQRTLQITFKGDSAHPEFLQATDRAALVAVVAGTEVSCADKATITGGTMVRDGINTIWTIPPDATVEGTYIVCYTSTANGAPVRVSVPANLVIYALQSPIGIFFPNGASPTVYSGQQFYLMFDTKVPLEPVLSFDSAASTKDAVLFATDQSCGTPLTASEVAAIPSSFCYKEVTITNPSGIRAPYLHLVMRTAPRGFTVCMRRAGRSPGEAFYTYEAIGDISNPATITVTSVPITAYGTTPTIPRAWVPLIQVGITYSAGYNDGDFLQLFFLSVSGDGIINDCYRPTKNDAETEASTTDVVLLNTTLQVNLATKRTQYPFPVTGTYQMCLQFRGANERAASVQTTLLNVGNPSPTSYGTPEIINAGETFTMTFRAMDAIFAADVINTNKAQIFVVGDDVLTGKETPNCVTGKPPPGDGTTTFDTFTAVSSTVATVQPRIMEKGYFFVCFKVYDQESFFPVPGTGGGYVFSVGLTGAQRYTVVPSSAYMGQQLSITILGNLLSNADHVKIVDITSMPSDTPSYSASCTADAQDADAASTSGGIGSVVNAITTVEALYTPRVNKTGRFILCYQSAKLQNTWIWVPDLRDFTVGQPHPNAYLLQPIPSYATEIDRLVVKDSPATALLGPNDRIKLVNRGTGSAGFDCTEAAVNSESIGALVRVGTASTTTESVYQVCAYTQATLTLCYFLAGGAWAEVPLQTLASSYIFEPVVFLKSPFTGPTLSPKIPQSYESFTLTFTSSDSNVALTFLSFAHGPQANCALDVNYVSPLYYLKTAVANTFTVVLSQPGEYQMYLGTRTEESAPKIRHSTTITIASCDPCGFSPTYSFLKNDVSLRFVSATGAGGGTLSPQDTVRIVPVSQGTEGLPCEAPTGPFATLTLKPDAAASSTLVTFFNFFAGDASTYLGNYYICYQKNTGGSNYAIVTDIGADLVTFSIYPQLPNTVVVCLATPSYLQTVVFTFSLNTASYPKVTFSNMDQFFLLPGDVNCDAKDAFNAPGVIYPVFEKMPTDDVALWVSTLPNGYTGQDYKLCFRLQVATVPHMVSQSPLSVLAQDPERIVTTPALITPETGNFKMSIYGTKLSVQDDVYVVDASERCDERCGETLVPNVLPAAVYTKNFVNATLLELTFTRALGIDVTLAVCYRRVDSPLVRLAVYYVGARNPTSYTTSFVPRVGTRPLLTFRGVGLSKNDRVSIVGEGVYCGGPAASTGTAVDAAEDGTSSSFYLPLVGDAIKADRYSVCYFVDKSPGYAQMTEVLVVQSGGPNSFTTSNQPMIGRATVITMSGATYKTQVGDVLIVTCAECSCFDGVVATLPYGKATKTAVTEGEAMTLRVGMEETVSYDVCYLVFDSGFAKVGLKAIIPVQNLPNSFTVTPTPTLQGERLTYTVRGFTIDSDAAKAPSLTDAAMLVTTTRLCWETETMSAEGILATTSAVKDVTGDEITWLAHVPSLGPGALPVSSFPMKYTLCYRETGQSEYVIVPFPLGDYTMEPASPSTFVTVPATVTSGMIGILMTFQGAEEGDKAYIVAYAGDSLTTNFACDDPTSTVLTQTTSSYPVYVFGLPPLLSTSSLVVCYIRKDATVAEVPQLLNLGKANPSGYTTNVPSTATLRLRQYISLTFTGTGLDPAVDTVVFTGVACASVTTQPPVSASFVRRVSRLTATPGTTSGTSVTVVVQFVSSTDITAHVCYCHGTTWSEIGSPLSIAAPQPTTLTLTPSIGVARVGQHVKINLAGNEGMEIKAAAVITAVDTVAQSWCHNFTAEGVREPLLKIVSSILLDVPLWQVAGPARVCVQDANKLWSDVAPTVDGSAGDVVVLPPNPSLMQAFPTPPRVGQEVRLTFQLLTDPSTSDTVRVTDQMVEVPCETSTPLPGLAADIPVVVDAATRTSVAIPRDSTDPLKYRSFHSVGSYKVCYYNAVESVWSVAGGSMQTGTLSIEAMAPSTWSVLDSIQPTFAKPFVLLFDDASGKLDAAGDIAWAAPRAQSCGVPFKTCTACIVFQLDVAASTVKQVRTNKVFSHIVGEFNLCYQLRDATAAMLLQPLNIRAGDVECVEERFIRVGQETVITFQKRSGVDVTGDTWRVSFYGTSLSDCGSGYDPAFPLGRARIIGSTSTTVQYAVEWPVSMSDERYLLCYTHNGEAQPVCTCEQINAQTGECFVQTLDASPLYFVSNPTPTYVGQTIQLSFTLDTAMIRYPVSKVKFVKYVDDLTICEGTEAFPLVDDTVTEVSATLYRFAFKHNFLDGPANLLVCTLSPALSPKYSRVGAMDPQNSNNLLTLRPYMTLTTFPTNPDLLRAMQTINFTFTHASMEEGDVVGSGDRITFVLNPEKCIESVINAEPPATVLAYFMPSDTSFSVIPAPVLNPSNQTRSSHAFATFDSTKGVGNFYVCYKLFAGTWAPIATALHILPAAVQSCSRAPPLSSPDNGGDANPRAMQYMRTTILATAETGGQRSPDDAVSVVPQSSPCVTQADTVFVSGVKINNDTHISLITFTPSPGTYKVCYRLGGVNSLTSNWSPVCTGLTFSEATPTGSVTGCLRLGQTLNTVTNQRNGFHFSLTDKFRFVPGNDQCVYVDGRETVSSSITVGDAPQTVGGTAVTTTGITFTIPNALLGTGTASLRLCYKDAVGNQFAVPLDPQNPALSGFPVGSRIPAEVQVGVRVTAGQRGIMIFKAGGNTEGGVLVPYAPLPPDPYEPGPVYNGAFDAATAVVLSSSIVYRDGRCYKADPTTYGVYGTSVETTASFDPDVGGSYIACYRPKGCSVEDVQLPFQVGGYNPIRWSVLPTPPRRGQLLGFSFVRNTLDSDSFPLTPGKDRAATQTDLNSCWSLSTNAGQVVDGTTELTTLGNIIFPAQVPDTSRESQFRVCYHLTGESWAQIPDGVGTLLPANPTRFTVPNGPARVSQINYIQFQGVSLSAEDRVKIIVKSDSCTATSAPPAEMVSHEAGSGRVIPGSSSGWGVTKATSTGTTLNISTTTTTGTYSVCYRLEKDTVWTLVYGDLIIYNRDPENVSLFPPNPLEGELFTLTFTSSEGFSGMSGTDRIALYTGILSCLAPGSDSDVIITSPFRTDLLPLSLPFQLAVGTRGEHTLCYWKDNIIIWGFPSVIIGSNPTKYTTYPGSEVLRTNQLISFIFDGFGLIAESEDKTDKVKVIPSTNTQTDEKCQTVESAAHVVYYYPLDANGTKAVQVIRSPSDAVGSYWLCYKLSGGQYHIFPGNPITMAAADPSGATSSKGDTIWNGESIQWTIQSTSPSVEGAFVFYSIVGCNDIPYYVVPEATIAQFPQGVAMVNDRHSILRASPSISTGTTLSLCYYAMKTITMLLVNGVKVVAGIPPVLEKPLSVKALEIFQFEFGVTPTADDYLVLLADPNRCVGLTAPSPTSDAFVIVETKGPNIIATTALVGSGKFYICYSHRIDHCAASTSQECARIVGEVVASVPNPSGWSMIPDTVFTSDLVEITLSRPTGNAVNDKNAPLWLALISVLVPTMSHVASACMAPISTEGNILLQRKANQDDVWNVRLNITGTYALCYKTEDALLPTIFPPIQHAGIEVHLTTVNLATFVEPPTVGGSNFVVLQGRGLSQDDQLVAVGISGTNPPSDACSNPSYTPRVPAAVSSDGYGLNSIVRAIEFKLAHNYVLCFQAAASQGPMVLITPTSFAVSPAVLSVRLVSVALTNTPLVLEFRGSGLRITNLAALVYLEADGNDSDDICKTAAYTAMTSTNADGTVSLYTTVPKQVGAHAVCFKEADAASTIRLPGEVEVKERSATGAMFITLPVCTALNTCSPQPVVALTNTAGDVTSDPFARVAMQLTTTSGTPVDELLLGGNVYIQKNYSVFYFLAISVSTAGEYIMEAHFTLLGKVTLVARSPPFTVTQGTTGEVGTSAVTCQPVGIIDRPFPGSGAPASIKCVIQTTSPLAPDTYKVQLNAGTSTEVVPGSDSDGFKRYLFTVTPPFDIPIIQFVSIVLTAAPPLESWPVANSPVIVRIGSLPGPQSSLSCESTSLNLPSPSMVRVSDHLVCHAQGKRIIDGVLWNIVASPKYMQLIRFLNDDTASAEAIDIGAYPESLEGDYVFDVTLKGQPLNVSVLGSVSVNEASDVRVPMQGSPSIFTVISEPQEASSSILCRSVNTMSRLWFVPVEPFRCTLSLGAEGHPINGLPHDFRVVMIGGGSTQPIGDNKWGTTLDISAAAPPILSPTSKDGQSTPYTTSGQVFGLNVSYVPLGRHIASATGTLVYVTSVEQITLGKGRVTLLFVGSGLSPHNRYGVRSTTDCVLGPSSEASATAVGDTFEKLELSFASPDGSYFFCFAPSDQTGRWQLLMNEIMNQDLSSSGGVDRWVALFIVSVILLFVLLVLLILLLWRVCIYERRTKTIKPEMREMYVRPPVNNRFIRRTESAQVPQQEQPQQQQQQQQRQLVEAPTKGSKNRVRVDIHDRNRHGTDLDVNVNGEGKHMTLIPEVSRKPEGKTRTKMNTYSDAEGSSSSSSSSISRAENGPRYIPPVPPPLPPVNNVPGLIGAIEDDAPSARITPMGNKNEDRKKESLPPSGPYQHLHHKVKGASRQEHEKVEGRAQPQQHPLMIHPSSAIEPPPPISPSPALPTTTSAAEEENGEQPSWVGPFVVKGHTSRPMVVSKPPSSSGRNKRRGKKDR